MIDYDLNTDLHRVRYFGVEGNTDPARHVQAIADWITLNPDETVINIHTSSRYDDDLEDLVYESTVLYLGGFKNVEA